MITKEEYKRELIRMWNILRGDEYKGKGNCDGVYCGDCQFNSIPLCNKGISAFEMIKAVEKWSGDKYMSKLLEKGYFKGAEGNMSIRYYFSNCGIVDDN